jgi:DNA-binding transcriptional regulator PaaX
MPGKKNAVIQEILDMLLEGTRLLLEWMENPHAQRRRIYGILTHEEWEKLFGDQRMKAALCRLKKRKWIEDRHLGNNIEFELSNEAIVEYVKWHVRSKPSHQDDEETLVVFDFPEAARKARQKWRRLLKGIGFTRLQLSVWSSLRDVGKEVQSLIATLGIQKWVRVYKAKVIS